ncbi:hypothetical protein G3A43_06900 [Paraburkholderia aspalathi]|nr:hypothetical protein [Paraburkholderia aspalathi]MBK3779979.1 hypothetical protein [Paraburkholderia aspalathi]
MSLLLRNFFFAVGLTTLLAMCQLNPATASFADLVRLVQSDSVRTVVEIITLVLVGLDIALGGFGTSICVSIPVRSRHAGEKKTGSPLAEPVVAQKA